MDGAIYETGGTGRRLWLVNLYFGEGLAPTGVLAESAARGLSERGWEVEVLASRVGYNASPPPRTSRFAGRVHWLYSIFRVTEGLLGRLLCWMNFYVAVAWWIFGRPLPAKVVLLTTPPYLHLLFIVRRWFSRSRVELVLWNQDTYPEVLTAVGLTPENSNLFRTLRAIENWSVCRLDRVLVLDRAMQRRLAEHGARSIDIVPNWHVPASAAAPVSGPLIERLREAKRHFRYIVIHTGNYGWGHHLGLVERHVRDHPGQRLFFFLFLGGGEKWPDLLRLCNQSADGCVEVMSYTPPAVLEAAVREAHFGLAALQQKCVGLMSPSKIHGYLAQGKPVIYLGPDGSNVADAIAEYGCGFSIGETDEIGWDHFVERVAAKDFLYEEYQRKARRAFTERYQERVGVTRFCASVGIS